MEPKDLLLLITKLRDNDISKKFENKIKSLEYQFQSTDEKGRELLNDEFNRLAKEIDNELILQRN